MYFQWFLFFLFQGHSHSSENDMADLSSLQNSQPESPKQLNGQQTPPIPITTSVKVFHNLDKRRQVLTN